MKKWTLYFLISRCPDFQVWKCQGFWQNGPQVIFTTAFEQYAIEGYKVDAIDYLLKPISYEEFLKAVQKAKKLFELMNNQLPQDNIDFIMVKADYKLIRIELKNLIYAEGFERLCQILP